MSDKQNIPAESSFVAKLVPDPQNPPKTRLVVGWLAPASEEGQQRIYLDPELSYYFDVPEEAVLLTVDIAPAHSPLGGMYIWLKKDAKINLQPAPQEGAAAMFQGEVQQGASDVQGGITIKPICDVTNLSICPTGIPIICSAQAAAVQGGITIKPICDVTNLSICPTGIPIICFGHGGFTNYPYCGFTSVPLCPTGMPVVCTFLPVGCPR